MERKNTRTAPMVVVVVVVVREVESSGDVEGRWVCLYFKGRQWPKDTVCSK